MARAHRVEDYYAGVLEGREQDAFERHLPSCSECARALEKLRALDGRLAAELSRTVPYREPRREWLEKLGYDLPVPRRERYHRLWLLAAPAIAALLAVISMFVLNEWKGAGPDLRRTHDNTLSEPFSGTITVSLGGETLLSGAFRHQPGDRWVTSYTSAGGQPVEEVRINGNRWRKEGDGGAWAPLAQGEPLGVLPGVQIPLLDVPGLLAGLRALDRVSVEGPPFWPAKYSGVDRSYLARLLKGTPSPSSLLPEAAREWLIEHPPGVGATGRQGRLWGVDLTFNLPDAVPVTVHLFFNQDYRDGPPILPPVP